MTTIRLQNKLFENPSVSYLVTRDVLSIQLNPSSAPRLVMIPAKSVVELKGTSPVAGFVDLIWQHRTHRIFEADLTRLTADRSVVERCARRLTA